MTEQFTIEVDGREYDVEYVTHDCLTSGDYSGYGYYGACNIAAIENEKPETSCSGGMGYRGLQDAIENSAFVADGKLHLPDVVTLHGGYNSQECYLLAGDYADEILGALDDYPILDDSAVSNFEMEALDEQYPSLIQDMHTAIENLADEIECEDTFERVNEVIQGATFCDDIDDYLRAVNNGDLPIEQDNGYECTWFLTDEDTHAQAIIDLIIVETDVSAFGVAMRIRRDNLMSDLFAA